jgi:filamentous hemagglutinin family protein
VAHQATAQPAVNAQPQGGKIVAGTATIGQTATLTQINQASQRAAIDWNSFDVGSKQQVQFQQPSASAITLNRVTGADPSQIAGKITANGQIALVNPAGVLFTKDAQVQAQSVVVSAAGISNQNFMAGRMVFDQPARPDAAVINQGRITVKQTGLAALVAPRVENDGVISARLGHVVLGGAETATLDLYGDGLLSIDVTGQVKQAKVGNDGKSSAALVTNTGTVLADGGTVLLTASAVDGVVQTLVTAGGKISAQSVGGQTGRIAVRGTGGAVLVAGDVLAQGGQPGTTGGQIEVNATGAVKLASTARVDASGQAGGGTIAVGTTLARAGGGPAVTSKLTATTTAVAAGAKIAADATGKGNGGQVTVLSAAGTSMAGSASARGGSQGGDGGNVEISADHGLTVTGTVDTRAPAGKIGLLTIDPITLTIGDNEQDNPIQPNADNSNLPATGIQTISAATFNAFTTNVSLQATTDITLGGSTPLATATTGASLTLNAGGSLTVNVGLNQPGPVTLTGTTSGITINAPINIGANVLTLNGESVLGQLTSVTAGILVANLKGGLFLDQAVQNIGTLGPITIGGPLSLNNGGNSLNIAAPVTVGSGTGAVVGVNFTGINLVGSPITQTSAGVVTTSHLRVSSPGGKIDLTTATNAIDTLETAGSTSGDFLLNNGSHPLQIVGAGINEGTRTLALTAGPITQTAAITAGTLTGSSTGAVDLSTATNAIANLGPFTAVGSFALNNGTNAIQITAPVSVAGVPISAGTTPGLMSLTAGAITQTAAGVITTGALTGASSGAVNLSTATNAIDSVGSFKAAGDFALTAHDITIAGPVIASGGTLALTADTITFAQGTLSAANGTVRLGPLTNGVTYAIAPDAASGVFGLDTTNVANQITAPTLLIGQGSGAAVAGSIEFDQDFVWPNTLNLQTTGAVTQQGVFAVPGPGVLGGVAGSVNLTGPAFTNVATLGSFQVTAGDFDLSQGTPLTVVGPLSANNINLTALGNTAGITVTGPVTAAGGNLVLAAGDLGISLQSPVTAGRLDLSATGGGVTQTAAGAINATTLQSSGNVAGAVDLSTATNAIANLGAFRADSFALNNGTNAIQITAPVTVTGGFTTGSALSLVAGAITQTAAAVISAGALTGSSSGAVNLSTATNVIGSVGSFTAAGDFALTTETTAQTFPVRLGTISGASVEIAAHDLAISGPLTATGSGGTLALTADTITFAGGQLSAPTAPCGSVP